MSDYDLLDDALESLESDSEFNQELDAFLEDDERRRPAHRRPVPTGRGAGYYRPRVENKAVTQPQLQSALAKISKDVKANAAGVKAVGARVDTLAAGQRKQGELLKKEAADRRREMAKLKSNLQMSALLPLLMSKSITVAEEATIDGTIIPAGTRLAVAPEPMAMLLPMLMGGDGLGGGGDSSNTLLLALAFSGGLG